jgi:predicted nucleic acid-binding protein
VLAVDASLVVDECVNARDFAALAHEELVAPPLMWSEARSAMHQLVWRGLGGELAERAHERLLASPVRVHDHPELGREAWQIADRLGWAKTYDAEYVALARLLGCRLLTTDVRLRRGAGRLGIVILPAEL